MGAGIVVPLIAALVLAISWAQDIKDQALVRIAGSHPFQAWPCQLEQTKDVGQVILLLKPDGGVARELRSDIPPFVWHGMADGRGVLWIAGDLRFPCLVATPGAGKVWSAKSAPYGASAGPARGPLDDGLIRSVTQDAFRNWLL